ncbi:phage tail protein [Massilia atriviolacea]|uniref:Phage tail protein n=1 Tax=Massilia atriviolacea TaxID=2495579 RepID=A0A430HF34_9BURK|nr:phage tail protein [Massilia atriviolacea]
MKPTYQLLANATDITAVIESRFLSLSLTDETGVTSDKLEIRLSDSDPAAPIRKPPKGAELELFLGYDGVNARMGLYCVDEIEYSGWPGEMTIRARGAIFDKTPKGKATLQSQKTRSWAAGTTLGAMAATIAREHGMEAAVAASVTGIALPYVAQQDESDLNLLIRLGKKYDVLVKPANGRLVLARRGESKSVGGQPLALISVTPDSHITSFHVTETARDSGGTVVAYYHAVKEGTRHEVKVGSGESVTRLKQHQPTREMAMALATAELAKRERQKATLSLTLPGRPEFGAEGKLRTSGFREGVDHDWVITRVTHNLTKDGGYSCSVDAELPTGGKGEVKDVADGGMG